MRKNHLNSILYAYIYILYVRRCNYVIPDTLRVLITPREYA